MIDARIRVADQRDGIARVRGAIGERGALLPDRARPAGAAAILIRLTEVLLTIPAGSHDAAITMRVVADVGRAICIDFARVRRRAGATRATAVHVRLVEISAMIGAMIAEAAMGRPRIARARCAIAAPQAISRIGA